jgi:hypothetical protein
MEDLSFRAFGEGNEYLLAERGTLREKLGLLSCMVWERRGATKDFDRHALGFG